MCLNQFVLIWCTPLKTLKQYFCNLIIGNIGIQNFWNLDMLGQQLFSLLKYVLYTVIFTYYHSLLLRKFLVDKQLPICWVKPFQNFLQTSLLRKFSNILQIAFCFEPGWNDNYNTTRTVPNNATICISNKND